MKYKALIPITMIVLFTACNRERRHPVDFYYWKANVGIGDAEKRYFENLTSQRLYVRFFDVDNDGGNNISPRGVIQKADALVNLEAEYIPVIFITNRTFSSIAKENLGKLITDISYLINKMAEDNKLPLANEIQIDCDWTEGTRDKYFEFLEKLKTSSGKKVSCTLRLHQIAQRNKTGVPPADNGVLMCYATTNPTEDDGRNSILDINLLKSYTKNINSYPLSFDIALPLYSWAIVTNHLGKIRIINGITAEELKLNDRLVQIADNQFEVVDDLILGGLLLSKGFMIRIEEITPELLSEARTYLSEKIYSDYHIIYYHLDKPFLERFTYEQLR